jgi:DNA-binding transcriptional MerR regulator
MQHEQQVRYDDAMATKGEFTISDLARIYDVSLRTLRFYEDKGLLHPRRQGTARFYNASDRIRLEMILKGKRLGFTLAEIQDLIASRAEASPAVVFGTESADLTTRLDHAQIVTQIAHLERQRSELDAAIEELREASARMDNAAG